MAVSESADLGVIASPRAARIAVAAIFCVNGALMATWFARIPDVKQQLGLQPGWCHLGWRRKRRDNSPVGGPSVAGRLVPDMRRFSQRWRVVIVGRTRGATRWMNPSADTPNPLKRVPPPTSPAAQNPFQLGPHQFAGRVSHLRRRIHSAGHGTTRLGATPSRG